jgi:hypothetical protein
LTDAILEQRLFANAGVKSGHRRQLAQMVREGSQGDTQRLIPAFCGDRVPRMSSPRIASIAIRGSRR